MVRDPETHFAFSLATHAGEEEPLLMRRRAFRSNRLHDFIDDLGTARKQRVHSFRDKPVDICSC